MDEVLRHKLLLAACTAALWAPPLAHADDPSCDYEVSVLDRTAAQLEITAACAPVLQVTRFKALGNRDHWWTDPKNYGEGKGRFTYDLGALAKEEDDMGSAMAFGHAVLVTPGFLLPLPETERAVTLRFRIDPAAGANVLTALKPDKAGYYEVPLLRLDEAG